MIDTTGPLSIGGLISDRESVHGRFEDSAPMMQSTKDLWRRAPNWGRLRPHQREALDMIAHKVSRILFGNPNHDDHWRDIAGYATRVLDYIVDPHTSRQDRCLDKLVSEVEQPRTTTKGMKNSPVMVGIEESTALTIINRGVIASQSDLSILWNEVHSSLKASGKASSSGSAG